MWGHSKITATRSVEPPRSIATARPERSVVGSAVVYDGSIVSAEDFNDLRKLASSKEEALLIDAESVARNGVSDPRVSTSHWEDSSAIDRWAPCTVWFDEIGESDTCTEAVRCYNRRHDSPRLAIILLAHR